MSKSIVVISRYWNNPNILAYVTDDEVGVRISLDDFITALKAELGSITFKISNTNFNQLIDDSVKLIIERVKETSVHAVT